MLFALANDHFNIVVVLLCVNKDIIIIPEHYHTNKLC